jgi:hypothetical protein
MSHNPWKRCTRVTPARYWNEEIGAVVITRRWFLAAAGGAVCSFAGVRRAEASLARGLSLGELVRASRHTLVVTPLESVSQWDTIGGRRLIVTDTRVQIEDALSSDAPAHSELWIRVLGGVVGGRGQRVAGQAELVLGKPSALFLSPATPDLAYVTGAAQGHYPLVPDARAALRLRPSPHLPELLEPERAAPAVLSGSTIAQARELVRAVRP